MAEPSALLQSLRGGDEPPADTNAEAEAIGTRDFSPATGTVSEDGSADASAEEESEGVARAETPEPEAETPATPTSPYKLVVPSGILTSELPEGVDAMLSSATDALAAGGVDAAIGQRLIDLYADVALAMDYKRDYTDEHFAKEDCLEALRAEWGEDFAKQLSVAKVAARRLGAKFTAYLDETKLGDHPAMLVALAKYGNGALSFTPEAARAEIDKRMAAPEYLKATSNTAGKRRAAEMRTLSRIAAEGEKTERPTHVLTVPKAPSRTESTKATAREEATKLLHDPKSPLNNKNDPAHSATVARWHVLLAQL